MEKVVQPSGSYSYNIRQPLRMKVTSFPTKNDNRNLLRYSLATTLLQTALFCPCTGKFIVTKSIFFSG